MLALSLRLTSAAPQLDEILRAWFAAVPSPEPTTPTRPTSPISPRSDLRERDVSAVNPGVLPARTSSSGR
ncbi:hypothetical protein [Fodinicola feengrottensis]|uniref:hypothetical protein n=1 Tax=Fodinicola feengrottensis TaxID=435914 RepID=UPI0024423A7D|nr:hypothetical protein [Fodinicola feengrottensis]